MEDIRTWRALLSHLTQAAQELQRIAYAVHVSPVTVTRWINRTSSPRLATLRQLIDVIPANYRQQFITLLQKEYPAILTVEEGLEPIVSEIPSAFYASVINIYTSSPPILRSSSICISILQQLLRHLDPQKLGMQTWIMQCVPSWQDQKVQSLRMTHGRGTTPWEGYIDHLTFFSGAESQAGSAVIAGHAIVMQSARERLTHYPTHEIPGAESIVASPILYFDCVAGCLSVVSTQPNYFTPIHLEIIHCYSALLVLAFDAGQFYPIGDIGLGVMPAYSRQEELLAHFQQRVLEKMLQAKNENIQLKRPNAELMVWKDLEDELLRLSAEDK